MCGTMQRQTDAENSFDLSDFSETDSLILKLLLFHYSDTVLKYAHENGCPWNEDTFHRAEIQNQQEVIKYLLDRYSVCAFNSF